ncbi:hypothetical protein EDD16DRAFT_1655049 [Pisolithus croceorrhizus]|nr:hypothetical protein EDD16DRAFT_1655049 [Pisolithus croceorrhizus]
MWIGEFLGLLRGENPTAAAAGLYHPGHTSGLGRVAGAVQAFDTSDSCGIHHAHDLATLGVYAVIKPPLEIMTNGMCCGQRTSHSTWCRKNDIPEKKRRGRGTCCVLRSLQSGHAVSRVLTALRREVFFPQPRCQSARSLLQNMTTISCTAHDNEPSLSVLIVVACVGHLD